MKDIRRFTSSPLAPYERGVEFGEAHASDVTRTVASYRRLFLRRALGPFDVDAWSAQAWTAIGRLAPEAAAELRGIAHGAGCAPEELASVNARTELLAIANPTGVDECSSVVLLPADKPAVAVQTWDWYDAMDDNWLHWTIPYPDGRRIETVTEYGVLAKIGVSSRGVGVLFNMLHHRADGAQRVGFPVHLLSRHVLETAGSAKEAVELARAADVSASTSLTVVDADDAASVELFPGGPGVLEPEDGLLVRTNHFVTEPARSGCLAAAIGPGSGMRRETLLGSLSSASPTTAEEAVAAMHHHADVGGVCAHPDTTLDPVLQHSTLATVVLDVPAGTLDVTPGGPCARAAT